MSLQKSQKIANQIMELKTRWDDLLAQGVALTKQKDAAPRQVRKISTQMHETRMAMATLGVLLAVSVFEIESEGDKTNS